MESFATASQDPEISVVIPVYCNAEMLHELYGRLRHVLAAQRLPYEMIFVDDAGPDGSLAVLRELAQGDPRVAVLALEQNVGQHRAVLTGLAQARGQWVVVMDADLQDPPEAIPHLLTKMQEGFAAVFAGRRGRYESAFRLLTSRLFKRLLHLLCGVPADAGLFVAMNRQMVKRLLAFNVAQPFVTAMMGCTGLPLASTPVLRSQRRRGRSTYSFWKRLKTGSLAIAWVLSQKWRADSQTTRGYLDEAPMKGHIGECFASTTDGSTEEGARS